MPSVLKYRHKFATERCAQIITGYIINGMVHSLYDHFRISYQYLAQVHPLIPPNFYYLDKIAANNIIATHMIRFSAECSVQCTKNPRCKSYNYQYNGNEGSKVCELIQVTREDCLGLKLMQKEGYAYYKEINSHPLKVFFKNKYYLNLSAFLSVQNVNSSPLDGFVRTGKIRIFMSSFQRQVNLLGIMLKIDSQIIKLTSN